MVEIIYPKFPGRILICYNCNALLAYKEEDIYSKNIVYCPVCKCSNEIEYNKEYNGIVVEEVKNDK